jgi:glycosyltransferase involved in cell wall biosynthesis
MEVAVVIPVFKQPQYLVESVDSVISQLGVRVRAVIVNDGCPFESTHEIGLALTQAFHGRVYYVRRPNGGLSAARNTGIDLALAMWPDVEAVFPLDADNRLSPHTLALLASALDRHPEAMWASPNLETFGYEHFVWEPATPYSSYRQLFDNQCDAGSLIRRTVFANGLRYDEGMRHGYEDWEFFIRAGAAGFRGTQAGPCGFRYRRKAESLLTTAIDRREQILEHMRASNPSSFDPRLALAHEDRDLPRFAWYIPTTGSWHHGTTVQTLLTTPAAPQRIDSAPLTIVAERSTMEQLGPHLAGCLLRGQAALDRHEMYALELAAQSEPGSSVGTISDPSLHHPQLVVAPWHAGSRLSELSVATGHLVRREVLRLGTALHAHGREHADLDLTAVPHRRPAESGDAETTTVDDGPTRPVRSGGTINVLDPAVREQLVERRPQGSHCEWSFDHHVVQLHTSLPFSAPERPMRTITFVAPWLMLGGVDHCVVQIAGAIRRSRPDWHIQLALTERNSTWGDAERLAVFDAVIPLADLDRGRMIPALDSALSTSDVVVNAHSRAAFDCLEMLRRRAYRPHYVCYSHVLDDAADGTPRGWPETAALLDGAIDTHLVISERMAHYLQSSGVPRDKIVFGRNAAVVAPDNPATAHELVRRRGDELASGRPLRLLYAGRLDVQKGLPRLERLARLIEGSGHPMELTVLGGTTLHGEAPDFAPWVTRLEPEHDALALSSIFTGHDVLVAPSRWEGMPLALLDAMAHGVVPISTDVGAVRELISPSVDGLLVDANAGDDDIAAEFFGHVCALRDNPSTLAAIGHAAIDRSWSQSWDQPAAVLVAIAEEQ